MRRDRLERSTINDTHVTDLTLIAALFAHSPLEIQHTPVIELLATPSCATENMGNT